MAKLINGSGNPAVYANEDADLIASICGDTTCISAVGSQYAATQEDANTIGLADGVIITKEGRRIQLDEGNTDLFSIPTGTAGTTNYYIIGYKLVTDLESKQTCETFVQKMNSSSETIPEDTFKGGATEVYVSVYRVIQDGLNIDSINGLLPTLSIGSTSSSHTGTGSSITNTISAGASIDTVTQTLLNNDHKLNSDLDKLINLPLNTEFKIGKLGTKDLYRKIITNNGGTIGNTGLTIDPTLTITYIDRILSLSGTFKYSSAKTSCGTQWTPGGLPENLLSVSSGGLNLAFGSTMTVSEIVADIIYTKA